MRRGIIRPYYSAITSSPDNSKERTVAADPQFNQTGDSGPLALRLTIDPYKKHRRDAVVGIVQFSHLRNTESLL
jgi:hypothetical protein